MKKDYFKIRIPESVDVSKGLTAAELRELTSNGVAVIRPVEKSGVERLNEAFIKAGLKFEREFYFAEPRKFRFDFAFPKQKIAVEYEGIIAKKSRHTTIGGYIRDCEKYNFAAERGWRVFRYTALRKEEEFVIAEFIRKVLDDNPGKRKQ